MKFWSGKKVLITGHTGFKGGWLSLLLNSLGADVVGVGLKPNTSPSFYEATGLSSQVNSNICDIRDNNKIKEIINKFEPEIVFHLAAQPLVGKSYENPHETYEINVMGTLNILNAIKSVKSVRSGVVVTSDKCYENKEWSWGYRENDALGGHDPYSSSKACTEILTKSFCQSFFSNSKTNISTARAGNVIGGGDWCEDRLIPDIYRSIENNVEIKLRNPSAVRPWQHVLDPLFGYMRLAEAMWGKNNIDFGGGWNFGPISSVSFTVEEVIALIKNNTKKKIKNRSLIKSKYKETNYLKLDCSKSYRHLNWAPVWDMKTTIKMTTDWYDDYYSNKNNSLILTLEQISKYLLDISNYE